MILLLALIWLIGNQLSKVESSDWDDVSIKENG